MCFLHCYRCCLKQVWNILKQLASCRSKAQELQHETSHGEGKWSCQFVSPNEKADRSRCVRCVQQEIFWPQTWHLPGWMLHGYAYLAPDQSELVVSFYFGNQRVILQIELQRLDSRIFLKLWSCMFLPNATISYPLAIAPAAGDIHPTMRRLKFMALWHPMVASMVLSQRWQLTSWFCFSVLTA